jgi:hypothetical protein
MAYTQEEIKQKFEAIIQDIEEGNSLRKALGFYNVNSKTFFEWLNDEEHKDERNKQYAHACEARADKIFDEILEIADKQGEDVIESEGEVHTNHNVIQRSKLMVDTRKWMLSKMMPKKYGDKLDITTDGDKIQNNSIINIDPLLSNASDDSTTEDISS